jgi:iron complex outermembrane receptor protein
LSVDYAPDRHWYAYASIARGVRSGGVNTVAALDAGEQGFGPEYNWTTEVALRHAGDGLLQQAQVTLYSSDWRDAQILGLATTPGVNALITTNTAGIVSRGAEFQLRARAGRLLAGSLAWSLVDARYRSGSDDPGSRAFCGLTAQPPGSDFCAYGTPRTGASTVALVPYLDGNQTARAPRTSWNLGVQLQPQPLAGGWQISAETTLAYQGNVFDRPINGAQFGTRTLLGARVMLHKSPWQVWLWGSNLAGERYVRTAANRGAMFYPSLPRPLDLLHGEGRRVGVALTFDLLP